MTRGGVKVETERDRKTGYIISRLSLIKAQLTDIGNYTCRLSSWQQTAYNMKGLYDTISVHVLEGENTKAIQEASGVSHTIPFNIFVRQFSKFKSISSASSYVVLLLLHIVLY